MVGFNQNNRTNKVVGGRGFADWLDKEAEEEGLLQFDDDFDDINNCDKITKATSQQPKIISRH